MRLSPRQLDAIATAVTRHEAARHYLSAEATRVGNNADKEAFEEFRAQQLKIAGY